MGPIGEFGVPELSLLARELTWSLAQLGKRHLATVMIGASAKNLSIADTVHGWMAGVNRALVSARLSQRTVAGVHHLRRAAFEHRHRTPHPLRAGQRLEARTGRDELTRLRLRHSVARPAGRQRPHAPKPTGRELAATRISIDFDGETCRYSALTDGAAIAERVLTIDPRRLLEINNRLLGVSDGRRALPPRKILA